MRGGARLRCSCWNKPEIFSDFFQSWGWRKKTSDPSKLAETARFSSVGWELVAGLLAGHCHSHSDLGDELFAAQFLRDGGHLLSLVCLDLRDVAGGGD